MPSAYKEKLARFVPAQAVDELVSIIEKHQIQLIICRRRLSKTGDFRPGRQNMPHRISVNANLNIYAFLIVFIHELAHLLVWEKYESTVKPHGMQWKETFGLLLRDFVKKDYFHTSLRESLIEYSLHPKAAGMGPLRLQRQLLLFDPESDVAGSRVFLNELPAQSVFITANGRVFRKEDLIRKRYRCLCMTSKRNYLFQPTTRVTPVENEIFKSIKN